MMVSLYKGPVIPIPWFPRGHVQHSHIRPGDAAALNKEWLKGCLFIVISVVAWSTWLIQQVFNSNPRFDNKIITKI